MSFSLTITTIISLLLLFISPFYYNKITACGILTAEYIGYNKFNIGDYIQSLATKQYCKGKKIIYVERDSLSNYKGKKVKLIMNAWWSINENNTLPSKYIDPLYVSYHLDNPESITSDFVNYLKKHEPIGCRDISTANTFTKLGIKSYFSGCLTLTLGKTYTNNHKQNNKVIYFVDCRLCYRYKQLIMNIIRNITNYSKYKVLNMRHMYSKSLSHEKRFEIADSILKKYESAFLVLTSRLHACLPCVAMNTSVILVRNNLDKRFTGLIDFINYIIINRTNTYIKVLHENGNIINPNTSKHYASKLEKTVKRFLFYS